MTTHRKLIISLLLLLPITLVLIVLTVLVVLGILPWQFAIVLFGIGVAIDRATAWVGAWNNVLALVDRLFSSTTTAEVRAIQGEPSPKQGEPMQSSIPSIPTSASSTYTCFIAHSHEDETFSAKLYADLKACGIKVWRFKEDAKWGESVWAEIEKNLKANDKLIVVCSQSSLKSGPVLREIERILNREDREGKNILFPIRIDDYILARDAQGNAKWQHPRKADLLAKVVGDFGNWKTDNSMYQNAFERLLKALQAE